MAYELKAARQLAAEMLAKIIVPGDTAVDATMGNGHDTLTLCRLVGEQGRVYAFDIQQRAVENTRRRLEEAGVPERARLFRLGHERLVEQVNAPIGAAIFNLGWLPGGDHAVTTHWETTKTAVEAALSLLRPLGAVVICAYPGHAEGDRERAALMDFLSALPPQRFNVLRQQFLNAGPGAPECFVAQKQRQNS